ncbi:hypothetical protein D3C73_1413100 [compost metagenome]
MTVDTIEVGRFTIDQEFAIVWRESNAPKPYLTGLRFEQTIFFVVKRQYQTVEIRFFRRPFLWIFDRRFQ